MSHQVHNSMQLVSLESQHPLIVTQRKAGDSVGTDVGEATCHFAVLGEHGPTFFVGQQVPLVRAHKRVHADLLTWLLIRHERRNVTLVELGRPV